MIRYRVHWKGYTSDYDTWEREENLDGCQDLLDEFREKQRQKKVRTLTVIQYSLFYRPEAHVRHATKSSNFVAQLRCLSRAACLTLRVAQLLTSRATKFTRSKPSLLFGNFLLCWLAVIGQLFVYLSVVDMCYHMSVLKRLSKHSLVIVCVTRSHVCLAIVCQWKTDVLTHWLPRQLC